MLAIVCLLVQGLGAGLSAQELAADKRQQPAPLFAGLFQVEPNAASAQPALDFSAQNPAIRPDQPQHTGFSALVRSTAADFNSFPRRRSTYVLLALGGIAAAATHPADDWINEQLQDSNGLKRALRPGRVIGSTWVQAGGAVGTYLVGRYFLNHGDDRTNKISHIGFDLLRAQIVAEVLTFGLKEAVRRNRPTGECCSFPSGHASATFATAAVLERHFGYRGAWPTFLIAGYVATSRLTDNRHFASDVLFGSALGMATGWTVVGRHGRQDYAILPVPTRGGAAISVMWHPRSNAASGN